MRGEGVCRLHGALASLPAGGAQLDPRAVGEGFGADEVEGLVRAAQPIPGLTRTPPTAQPLAVQQLGAPQFDADTRAAQAVDRLALEDFGALAVGEQRPRAGLDAERPVGTAGAGHIREAVEGAGGVPGHPGPRRRLDKFSY